MNCHSEAFKLWRKRVPMAEIAAQLNMTVEEARADVNAGYLNKRGR